MNNQDELLLLDTKIKALIQVVNILIENVVVHDGQKFNNDVRNSILEFEKKVAEQQSAMLDKIVATELAANPKYDPQTTPTNRIARFLKDET